MLKQINGSTLTQATTAQAATLGPISMAKVKKFSAQINVTVNTPSAKTFAQDSVVPGTDTIVSTAHGFPTGLKVRLTSTGTLPAGLTTGVDYFVIVVTANSYKLADSLAHAIAGTAIDITDTGTAAATGTATPTAIAGATAILRKSNDGLTWTDEGSSQNITATGTLWFEKVDPTGVYLQIAFAITAGSFSAQAILNAQGDIN